MSPDNDDYWFNAYRQAAPAPSEQEYLVVKVAGVTFENRQAVVAALSIGERLILARDPANQYDRNAIEVRRTSGEQVGFLPREMAAVLAPVLDSLGGQHEAVVTELTGGYHPTSSRGVVIRFLRPRLPDVPITDWDE